MGDTDRLKHKDMIVLDAHCDAPSQMVRLRDFGVDNAFAQVDFPKMRRGGVDASFFAAYVPARLQGQEATDYARRLLEETFRQVSQNADKVAFARCAGGVRRNRRAGLLSVLLGIENASALQEDLSLLKDFYKRGVRYVTLTHSADNQVGDSCTGKGTWGGLSPFGKQLVPEMNRCRMLIDVAHGACRALASHRRCLPDELIRGIADGGGVVCISIYPPFLDDAFVRTLAESGLEEKMSVEDAFIADPADPAKRAAWEAVQLELQQLKRPGVERVADHIEHAVAVAGIDHVGIGTDYDGIEVTVAGLEDVSRFPALWEELRRRGFSAGEISRIAGGNLLRVLSAVRKA